ncbi:hypothetical protein BQ8794_240217 [Mesorhizobium prunaredense]|uniref:Transposase n=1 Tax=Mesorhizobium prunaredense TaxID=1631249 RepID=A0A1R3V7Y6_9HYPH|nr:hypothetical protein BQ8794_240217 [Mesorhizobium prunaredense]
MSTFSEVLDALADNSASLQDASFETGKPDANPEIVDAPDQRSFTSKGMSRPDRSRHRAHARGEQWRRAWSSAARLFAGLSWPLPEGMDDEGLDLLLFPAPKAASQSHRRPVPDWSYVEKELRRRRVTRVPLWEECGAANPDGFGYTWFCTTFEAGKSALADDAPDALGRREGVCRFRWRHHRHLRPHHRRARPMKLFVAAMGASNYSY